MRKFLGVMVIGFVFMGCNFDHLDPKPYWEKHQKEAEIANRVLPSLTDDGKLPPPPATK